MTTQLTLYNNALMILGETGLASTSEARESRYLLDNVWASGTALNYVLSEGLWTFATRSVQISNDPNVTPQFGLMFSFSKPTDFIRTVAFCSDPYFNTPLTLYQDQGANWLCDIQLIFVRYVSNDATNFGGNLSLWPETFTRWVEHYLAFRIAPKVINGGMGNPRYKALGDEVRKILVDARSKDAMELPSMSPATGTWIRSRWGRNTGWDRGNPNRLIG